MDLSKAVKRGARPALGRGLSALISSTPVAVEIADASIATDAVSVPANKDVASDIDSPIKPMREGERRILYVPVGSIVNNPKQPRQHFEESEIEELASSIRTLGVLQPVLLRPQSDGGDKFEIVAGERRWRASQRAGLDRVPAIVTKMSDLEALEIALVENVQRSNLNPIEEAVAYQRLIDEFQLSQKEMAERVGKDRASVANYLRLLSLPESVRELVRDGKLSLGHAKAILTIKEPVAQQSLARKVVEEQLSVRTLEGIVSRAVVLDSGKRSASSPTRNRANEESSGGLPPDIIDRMRNALGTKVTVRHHSSGRGKIEIEYFSEQELDRVVEHVCRR